MSKGKSRYKILIEQSSIKENDQKTILKDQGKPVTLHQRKDHENDLIVRKREGVINERRKYAIVVQPQMKGR